MSGINISRLSFQCLDLVGSFSCEPDTLACVSRQWKLILAPSSYKSILNACMEHEDIANLCESIEETEPKKSESIEKTEPKKSLRMLIEAVWKDATVTSRPSMPPCKRILFNPEPLVNLVSRINADKIIAIFKKANPQNPEAFKPWCVLERNDTAKVELFCKRLRVLDLSETNLVYIPEIIGRLSSLRCLLLKSNKLTTFPVGICSMHGLKKLDLRDNKITHLPSKVENLTELEWVNLSDNGLSQLPPQVSCWTKIKMLFLRRNLIKTLPPEVGCWQEARKIHLAFNPLETLPETVTKWEMLEELDLSGCKLEHLPSELDKQKLACINKSHFLENKETGFIVYTMSVNFWPRLTTLSLRSNCFTAFPQGICQMTSLTDLDISRNAITKVPPALGNLVQLQYLDLSHNKLTNLCSEVVNLKHLLLMNILGNPIPYDATLPMSVFYSNHPAIKDARSTLHHYGCVLM